MAIDFGLMVIRSILIEIKNFGGGLSVRLNLLSTLGLAFASICSTAASDSALEARKFYYPNTEPLGEAEMRVVSLGTGTPNFRHSQASASWLVELGNGDKFLFDVGTGSLANLAALEIPYTYLDKVFISHLHVDHIGDLDALFVGGWVSNRTVPLQVWGPSGLEPEYGTAAAMDGLQKMLAWDVAGRRGNMPSAGGHLKVTEFDYSKTQVVYENDGVVIRSWPAIHGIDGSVSYSVEWNGLKFVYSGDTNPNKWFVENAKEADLVIHECYLTVQQFIDIKNYDPERARLVATVVHTPPDACGKLFSAIEPRHAIAYHTFADFDIAPDTIAAIRMTYDGPLTLAQDMLVWNISAESVTVREVIGSDNPLPVAPPTPAGPPDPSERKELSDWLNAGRLDLGQE
ncbi:guanitoxin biosynthesis MBL fold metallo-hydrolase GntH [Ruegeria atlantica]|uniref:guanitoxin biosynthesis MBL fold metallo-hydrolase GntH n=1 Tax=Ruegeria atlantica TaxID=81569 RepID=UPI002494C8BC|nr:guanitoxin biosynthesis MBL fold metallo-hydrolase GntH [Ruegeria atlantica]